MKQKLLKPIITNEKLIAVIALLLAIFLFGFWRILIYNSGVSSNTSLLKNSEIAPANEARTKNISGTGELNVENRIKIPILMYHHVGELPQNADKLRKNLNVTSEDFEIQVAWLQSQGYKSLTLNSLLLKIKNKEPLPEKPIILTFDDGYKETLTNAPKILKQYGFTGSFGIITQFVGISLGNNDYASWTDIRSAKNLGMEMVSHTQDHFDGTDKKYTDIFISNNFKNSQKDLKDHLGINFPILIYPYGHYDNRLIKLANEAGFEMGITTKESRYLNKNNLMEIPRIRINGGASLESFKRIILD